MTAQLSIINQNAGPRRIARSLAESPTYDPAWRHLQVMEYLQVAPEAEPGGCQPPWLAAERDRYVRELYAFRSAGTCRNQASVAYACEVYASSGAGSRIKAMVLAKMTDAEIAERIHCPAPAVTTFCRLFFEVDAYLDNPASLEAMIFPADAMRNTAQLKRREEGWMRAALKFGRRGIDWLVDGRADLSPAQQAEVATATHSLLHLRALEFAISVDHDRPPGAEAIEHVLKSADILTKNPVADDKKGRAYAQGLSAIIRTKVEENPDDPQFAGLRANYAKIDAEGKGRSRSNGRRRMPA